MTATVQEVAFGGFVMLSVFLLLFALQWGYDMATRPHCPNCKRRSAELVGEWDGEEDWQCRKCFHFWSTPYDGD